MKRQSIYYISLIFIISACTVSPRPIEYGNEECFYCKMAIVDAQHAAELVTNKGKIYVYDAIECMVAHYNETSETEYSYELVSDYESPGTWLNAQEASYLISAQLPSPMGANLNAFANSENANAMQQSKPGDIFNWETLIQQLQTD